jgi:hypothetical protein
MPALDRPHEGDSETTTFGLPPVPSNRPEAVMAALGKLAGVLEGKGFAARVVESPTRPPFVRVSSRETSQLSENVSCGVGEGGELWFRWSWGDLIVPVRHVESAAERVGHILTPRGR